jgi:uncharacterized RDD family membrane protein YckC
VRLPWKVEGRDSAKVLPPPEARPTQIKTPHQTEYFFADVFSRAVACIIDIVILVVAILAAASVINAIFGPTIRFDRIVATAEGSAIVDHSLIALNGFVATLLSVGYFVISWMILSASPGQLLLALQVRNAADGGTLRLSRAILRWVLLFPPFSTAAFLTTTVPGASELIWASAPIWYLMLLATMALSPTKQGLHDRLAHSIVLRQSAHQPEVVPDERP